MVSPKFSKHTIQLIIQWDRRDGSRCNARIGGGGGGGSSGEEEQAVKIMGALFIKEDVPRSRRP